MSETMNRRDIDVDKRMVDLISTVQDLTAVKAVVTAAPSRPSPVPVALNAANVPSTSAFPTQQPIYREVVQCYSGTQPEQNSPSCNHLQCTGRDR